MEFSAAQIAHWIQGRIIGDPDASVSGFSPIEEGQPGHLSFIGQEKFVPFLDSSPCNVLIVSEGLIPERSDFSMTLIAVPDAYLSFQILMKMYVEIQPKPVGIQEPSKIHQTAILDENVFVGAFVYIDEMARVGEGTQIHPQAYIGKNVQIGKHCYIGSGVKIYHDCILGDRCIVQANAVIGADGFGFQPGENGYTKIPQLGNVILEDDVEVGANTTIDRATIGSTLIGKGTKLDNLIQVAHNVRIGENNVIAAQAGIAGSTTIGHWNMIGGQTGIVGHINIGNRVKIQAQSGVNASVKDEEILYGSPAISASDYRRNYVHFRNFNKIVDRINSLEKHIKNLGEQ